MCVSLASGLTIREQFSGCRRGESGVRGESRRALAESSPGTALNAVSLRGLKRSLFVSMTAADPVTALFSRIYIYIYIHIYIYIYIYTIADVITYIYNVNRTHQNRVSVAEDATYRVSDRAGRGDPPDSISKLRATTGWTREGVYQDPIYFGLKRRHREVKVRNRMAAPGRPVYPSSQDGRGRPQHREVRTTVWVSPICLLVT